jgi:outer membrane protein assembly factor BamB
MWRIECENAHALIKAGNTLLAGGTDAVVAYDPATGKEIWEAKVDGIAHGLAVAQGQLYVSTDKGYIYSYTGA